jgi:hypothetical protein
LRRAEEGNAETARRAEEGKWRAWAAGWLAAVEPAAKRRGPWELVFPVLAVAGVLAGSFFAHRNPAPVHKAGPGGSVRVVNGDLPTDEARARASCSFTYRA